MISVIIALSLGWSATPVTGTVTDGKRALRDAVVWIEGDFKVKPTRAKIDQKNKRFVPHILVVPTGSTVSFPNRDNIFHNVFAVFEAKTFDLGMYPKGQSREVTFDKAGIVSVLCNMHSGMSAYVVVVDSPYFTKTDKKGAFKLDVPPGTYRIHAWHESGKRASRALTVSGKSSQIDLVVSRK